jgi:signal transduction histidine kinase/CheY-like chemotaxis protein
MASWQQDEPPVTPGGVTRSTLTEHGSPHASLEHERVVTEALGEIARELTVGVDRDTVLRGIAEHVRRLCPADLVVLAVSDERPHEARVVARAGPEGAAAHDGAVFHASDPGPAGQALMTGIPVVADCQPDPCRRPEDAVGAEAMRAVAAVPLRVGDRTEVLLLACRRPADPFRPREIATIEVFARHAALAVRCASLRETAEARVAEVAILQRIGPDLSHSLDLPSVLGTIVDAARRHTASDAAFCAVVDPVTLEAETVAASGAGTTTASRSRLRPGQGIGGRLWSDRQPFRTGRDPAGSRDACADDAVASAEGIVTALAVPILNRDALIGFLWVGNRGHRLFTERDEGFLSGLAGDAEVAMANARAHAERDRALEELRASRERLVRAERLRALGEMASGVAHDFNNLLAVILGRAQLLMLRTEDPQVRRGLTVIEAAATEAAQTIRRIHEFTRTRQSRAYVPVDLAEVLRQAVDLTKGRWKGEAQIDGVAYAITTDIPPMIRVPGDPVELRELFANLLLNAFDAMLEGGSVAIAAQTAGNHVVVEVLDTGPGMPPDVRERVFEPFFTTKGPRRTGLGLSVAYGITQRHRGSIEVDSQEGRGTTFMVTLPLVETAEDQAPETGQPLVRPGRPARVLLIEDEPMVGEVLVDLLRSAGHSPRWATDGPAGLGLIDPAAPPDVALVDLGLPGMSGLEVAGRIQAAHPEVPIVLVTGWADRIDPEALRRSGISQVVAKPFRTEEILRIVAAAVEQSGSAGSPKAPRP